MNDNMEAGADIHAGDGGYRLGTKEGYDAFVKKRNPMNERIKELERQAEKFVMSIPASLDINEYTSVFNEKFAELIVRECEMAMSEMPRYAKTKPFQEMENSTIEDCIRTVKEHFGVDE